MPVILPNVPGVVRIVHKGTLNGLPYVNTFHVQGGGAALSDADAEAIATAMHNAYFNAFIPLLGTGTSLVTTTAIDLSSRTAAIGIEDTPHNGTVTQTQVPANSLAVCISWIISDRYRGGHPRMYIPLRTTADLTSGHTLLGSYVSTMGTAAQAYLSAVEAMTVAGQTWFPVCVRYFSQGQLLVSPFIRPITGSAVHGRVDSMRRRTGKETG